MTERRPPLFARLCVPLLLASVVQAAPLFEDVSATHLPLAQLQNRTMDVRFADFDQDGDLDAMLALEFEPNRLLLNDGKGKFSVSAHLPAKVHDSEDVGVADFDGDGDLDVIFVSEDDQTNEFYLNDGAGRFVDVSERLPVTGITNAVAVHDLDGDGDADIVLGNKGQNHFLRNDGRGSFEDATRVFLPRRDDSTQDLEFGDVDGDGDLDLLVGNEDANRLLINNGQGFLRDETADRLPLRTSLEETREGDFGDIDGDGDLDLFFANALFTNRSGDGSNRLLVNDGKGFFTDVTADRLPRDNDIDADGDFLDFDRDGDLDIVTGTFEEGKGPGKAPFRALRNDGKGRFADATGEVFPPTAVGNGFDLEAADIDGDGDLDLYLANRWGADILLLRVD